MNRHPLPAEDGLTDDWPPLSSAAVAVLALFALWVVWEHFFTTTGWVVILDSANLALHEAGHPVVGLLWTRLGVYGGTLFQLLFPALFAHHFQRQRQTAGWAAAMLWLGENLMNIGRYMKDARAQMLPLAGGGEHDWTEIFSRWGVLAHDVGIGNTFRLCGLGLVAYAVWWAWRQRRHA